MGCRVDRFDDLVGGGGGGGDRGEAVGGKGGTTCVRVPCVRSWSMLTFALPRRAGPSTRPRVLFSHIPLYRPEGTSCGRERESPRALRQGAGKNYQNELDEATTKWLIETLRPTIIYRCGWRLSYTLKWSVLICFVYSGDDHDSCIINHPYFAPGSSEPVVETTVKAFVGSHQELVPFHLAELASKMQSMAMGVRVPGYHLLSLYPPTSSVSPGSATFTQTNCTLPDQISIWLHVYLPLFCLVTLSLGLPKLWRHVKGAVKERRNASARSNGLPVHRHKKSLSRQLFSAGVGGGRGEGGGGAGEQRGEEEYAEDADSQFPTFPFSPSPGDDYGYHAGLDSDALPTSNLPSPSLRTSAYDEQEAPSRVRRVSRVWMWEKGDGNPFAESIDPLTPGRYSTRSHASHAASPLLRLEDWLLRNGGPVGRWLLRPVVRGLRHALGRVLWAPRRVARWVGRTTVGEILGTTAGQVGEVAWPGVVAWVAVWVWCAW